MSGYHQILYADPPWIYRDQCHAGKRGAVYKYPVMDAAALAALRPMIDQLAAPDCLLAMWWVPPQPAEALQLVAAWGFKLKTFKGFTWHKLTKNGRDHFGMGSLTRANTEDCLFAVRGKPKRQSAAVPQLIHAPVREHSRSNASHLPADPAAARSDTETGVAQPKPPDRAEQHVRDWQRDRVRQLRRPFCSASV